MSDVWCAEEEEVSEMEVAVLEAQACGAWVLLGDRDFEVNVLISYGMRPGTTSPTYLGGQDYKPFGLIDSSDSFSSDDCIRHRRLA